MAKNRTGNEKLRAVVLEFREAPEGTLCCLPSICFTPDEVLQVVRLYGYTEKQQAALKRNSGEELLLFNEELQNFEARIFGTLGVFEPDNVKVRYFPISTKLLPRYLVVSSSLEFDKPFNQLCLEGKVLEGFDSYSHARLFVRETLKKGVECFIRPRLITDAISVLRGEKTVLPLVSPSEQLKRKE